MGAIQDALSGFYLTAGARIIEALLATAGLIAGVSAGLALAPTLGVSLIGRPPGRWHGARPTCRSSWSGAIIAACAFAFTCYAPLRALPADRDEHPARPPRVPLGAGPARSRCRGPPRARRWSIGLVSYSIAGRVGVPPLVVVVPALVPMLPGLLIYRGLSYMSEGDTLGILQLPRPRRPRSRWRPA